MKKRAVRKCSLNRGGYFALSARVAEIVGLICFSCTSVRNGLFFVAYDLGAMDATACYPLVPQTPQSPQQGTLVATCTALNADPRDADPRDADPRDADPRDADPRDADARDADARDDGHFDPLAML